MRRITSIALLTLANLAWFALVACAAPAEAPGAGERTAPISESARPLPIFAHNLSLDRRWREDGRRDYLAILESVVSRATTAGYERVMLARPLPAQKWLARKGAEPLEQFAPLGEGRQEALRRIVERYPGVEFSTHLGYERLLGDVGRQRAAWDEPGYVEAMEREVRRWNDLGYFVWLEGIGGPKPGGRQWHERAPKDLRVGGIVWPMDEQSRLTWSDQSPMLGEMRFLEGKAKQGQLGRPLFPPGAERYVAIAQSSAEHVIRDGRTQASPLLASLLKRPNVGLVVLNTGRKDQRLHERIMELDRARRAR
jgi:hypothetical protein